MITTAIPFVGAVPLALFLAKATLLLLVALIASISLEKSTAGARHLVWLAALAGVLALPLLSRISALRVGLLPSSLATPTASDAALAPAISLVDAPPALARVPAAHGGLHRLRHEYGIGPAAPVASAAIGAAFITAGGPLLQTLAIVWAAVAIALLGWLAAGSMSVRRIVAEARELTASDWTMQLCEVADRLDLDSPPRLLISDRIEMAFACRALVPTVVLPADAESWTADRRQAVLFHELAHVKRHDLAGHALGRIACALYWFHPLVWTAARHLRAESERACDDLVLSCGARPSEYAQHLLDMVTSVRNHGAPVMALPMARKKEFEGRMLAILDPAIRRASPGRAQTALVVATVGIMSLMVAAIAPAEAAAPAVVSDAAPVVASVPGAPSVASPSVAPRPAPAPQVGVVPEPDAPALPSVMQEHSTTVVRTDNLTRMTVNAVMRSLGLSGKGSIPGQASDTGRAAMLAQVLTNDADAVVRRTAAWGLQDMQTPAGRAALIRALRSDTDVSVREMSAWALSEYSSDESSAALADALRDRSAKVRVTAAWALGERSDRREAGALESLIVDPDAEVRQVAIWSLGQLDLTKAPQTLVNALTDQSAQVRQVAAWTLGQIEDVSAVNAIAKAFLTETDKDTRMAEIWALSSMDRMPQPVVDAALKSPDAEIRERAVAMLSGHSGAWPWPWPRPQPRPFP